jgi:hypothetical protein
VFPSLLLQHNIKTNYYPLEKYEKERKRKRIKGKEGGIKKKSRKY